MRASTVTRGQSGRRPRLLAGLLLSGALVLTGCSGDDDPGTDDGATAGTQTDADGDGTPDATTAAPDAEGATREPVPPPTAPADIEIGPGDRSASGDGDVTIEGARAAFVLPSGNIACTVNEQAALCQVTDGAFQPQGGHLVPGVLGSCSAAEANAIMTSEAGAWTCVPEPLLPQATVAQGGWWVDEVDGTTTSVEDLTVAVLPYGDRLTVGSITCSSAEAGVTCRNNEIGRQFTLSRSNYTFGS